MSSLLALIVLGAKTREFAHVRLHPNRAYLLRKRVIFVAIYCYFEAQMRCYAPSELLAIAMNEIRLASIRTV